MRHVADALREEIFREAEDEHKPAAPLVRISPACAWLVHLRAAYPCMCNAANVVRGLSFAFVALFSFSTVIAD